MIQVFSHLSLQREGTEIKLSPQFSKVPILKILNTPQQHNILQQKLATTLNLAALTESIHFFLYSANMTT